ncbi:hypothetical protein SmJEL517_g02787 [Synchytrium microbalum]|uniref:Uncharacterized protein n=1 Tax=Synchytrium microbalum TaxID=1806994 RepID=A0A507C5X1_9FUNG|nr:uncharacterized protein SmJEL517_g02787 [Synchytrium microbalum]TPX34499.1 hypothetical protein SmJEL517_g02787 [Synchytrium microbalum]
MSPPLSSSTNSQQQHHNVINEETNASVNRANIISKLTFQLVQHTLGHAHQDRSVLVFYLDLDHVHQYAMRILASRLTVPSSHDVFKLVDTMKKNLAKRDNRPEKAAELGTLVTKLSIKKVPQDKWSVLYFLNSLSDKLVFSHLDGASSTARDEPWIPSSHIMAPQKDIPPTSAAAPRLQSYSPTRTKQSKGSSSPNRQRADIYYSSTRAIREVDLVRDMIYVFQGIDGKFVKFDISQDTYVVDPDVGIPQPTQDILTKLSELGYLYRRIQEFLDSSKLDTSIGLVGQSLCSALFQELTDYHRLVAILEGQLNIPDASSIPSFFVASGLSLRRLVIWTHEPLQRLRMMGVIADLCSGHRGGALISLIYNYINHGDPFVQQFINHLLVEVSRPFYEMLTRWIYEGEIDDPFNEFFVMADPSADDQNLWRSKYSVRQDMLPSYIPKAVARKIYLIGKSLNFIRISCKDSTFVVSNKGIHGSQGLEYGDLHALETIVESVYTITSKTLLDILFNRYKLMEHFAALKRFLLLGQGDFVQYLMDSLGSSLSKPASTLYRHNLTGTLEAAIRLSNAQYDDVDVLKRLDVKILEVSPGDLGWDVFTLEYHVDPPISTVFTPQTMHQYGKLFTFLWRLKRVEHALSSAWRQQMTRAQLFRQVEGIAADFHYSNVIWSEMIHFTYQLQYYILFEVLECSWDELVSFINKKSGDLDLLVQAHNKYLNGIITKGLLASGSYTPSNQNLFPRLMKLFDTILQFRVARDMLYHHAMTELRLKQVENQGTYKKNLEGRVGLSESDDKPPPPSQSTTSSTENTLQTVRQNMKDIAILFRDELSALITMISKHPDTSLRFLSFRLNFNEFYSEQ